jgi:hypothetical protein
MAIAALLTLAAVTVASADLSAGRPAQADQTPCIVMPEIAATSVLDDRHVILRGSDEAYFLISTRTRCAGLRQGAAVGLSFGDNARLCPPIEEHLVPNDGWRCRISDIVEVENEDAARTLIRQEAESSNRP